VSNATGEMEHWKLDSDLPLARDDDRSAFTFIGFPWR